MVILEKYFTLLSLSQTEDVNTNSASTPKESPEPEPFLSPIISMWASIYNGVLAGSALSSFGSSSKAQPLRVLHETWTILRQRNNFVVHLSIFVILSILASRPQGLGQLGRCASSPPRPWNFTGPLKTDYYHKRVCKGCSRVFAQLKSTCGTRAVL